MMKDGQCKEIQTDAWLPLKESSVGVEWEPEFCCKVHCLLL